MVISVRGHALAREATESELPTDDEARRDLPAFFPSFHSLTLAVGLFAPPKAYKHAQNSASRRSC